MNQQEQTEFLPYPNLFNYDSTNSGSNRTSYSSINNKIDDDDDDDYAISSAESLIEDSESPEESVIEESVSSAISVVEETLYVALSTDMKEGGPILLWALQNFVGSKICILHVHQSDDFVGGRFPANTPKEQEHRRKHRELEKWKMQNVLNEYILICEQVGVLAEKIHIETSCIEKGIVKIISQYGIRRLVMGAAAKKCFSRTMTDPKSEKAKYVNAEAPVSCHIWFVCKGHLIYTREARLGVANDDAVPKVEKTSPNPEETEESEVVVARSVTLRTTTQENQINPHHRAMSLDYNVHGKEVLKNYPDGGGGVSTSKSVWDAELSLDEWEGISTIHISQGSRPSASSIGLSSLDLTPYVSAEGTQDENEVQFLALPPPKDDVDQASPPGVLEERVDYKIYNQLEQAVAEARNSSFEFSKERVRRGIAEQEAANAILRARASESVYADELKRRKEVEAALLKERIQLQNIRNQRDEVRHELQYARDQQSQFESRIVESDNKVRELEERIISAVGLLKSYKKQKDDLQIERDNALKLVEDLKQRQTKVSSTNLSRLFSEFSFFEIEEATRSFHPSLKIGEGGYGTIYKGLLRHTEVAIKMLHSHSMQGPSEYQQEVDILSKLRHPNLVTLIGACPDVWTLIYEYLPNGSLEDRLNCKDNSAPLSWQTRIRIAAELCSALVFLHSSKPHSVVHGDLKPSNILLDANLITKLGDFGICRVVLPDANASVEATACYRADPQGTFAYMDPELFTSGELTTKSDVYSFGVVLLRLLTGKAAVGLTKEVQNALDNGNLKSLLDCSAGDWPYVQAHQLTHLALRCVELNRKKRPDLGSEVWRVLQAMQASCGGSSSSLSRVGSEDACQAPHYFICPIFQEVMQDPHVAADGFTYEAESLKGWLESGHNTSPMTNLKLENTNLVPNLALRSAIQEWLQKQKQ